MICHCGKETWLYDANTLTCKEGHRTAFETAYVPTSIAKLRADYLLQRLVIALYVIQAVEILTWLF